MDHPLDPEVTMDPVASVDRWLVAGAWGLLCVWWGVSIFFDRIPFGAGLIGTGLILLGVNGIRFLNRIRQRGLTTVCGILALAWGALELARSLPLPFQLNDWAIFSILLVVLG